MNHEKKQLRIIFRLLIAFFVIFMIVEVKFNLPCVVCGKPTISENILCRIATGFDDMMMHQDCVYDYQYYHNDGEYVPDEFK